MSAGPRVAAAFVILLAAGGAGIVLLISAQNGDAGASESSDSEAVDGESNGEGAPNGGLAPALDHVADPPNNVVVTGPTGGSAGGPRAVIQRPPPGTAGTPGQPGEPVRIREPSIGGQPIPPPPQQVAVQQVEEVEPQRLSAEEFRESVRTQFTDAMPAMRDCYNQILELSPDISDRLLLNIEVSDPADGAEFGRSSLQSIDSSDLDLEETECFAEVVGGMQFPAPDNDPGEDGQRRYNITYPIVLSPE